MGTSAASFRPSENEGSGLPCRNQLPREHHPAFYELMPVRLPGPWHPAFPPALTFHMKHSAHKMRIRQASKPQIPSPVRWTFSFFFNANRTRIHPSTFKPRTQHRRSWELVLCTCPCTAGVGGVPPATSDGDPPSHDAEYLLHGDRPISALRNTVRLCFCGREGDGGSYNRPA